MNFQLTDHLVDCTATVKNTFINLECVAQNVEARRSSELHNFAPASSKEQEEVPNLEGLRRRARSDGVDSMDTIEVAEGDLRDCMATVKNTFLTFECVDATVEPRRRSVPASSKLCQDNLRSKLLVDNIDHRSRFTSGDRLCLPDNIEPHSRFASDGFSTCAPSTRACSESGNDDSSPLFFGLHDSVPPPPSPFGRVAPGSPTQHLNSKAAAFKPLTTTRGQVEGGQEGKAGPNEDRYKKNMAEVVRLAKASIQASEHVINVHVSEDANGWSVIIQPKRIGESLIETKLLITLAKEAILEAASTSKCVYLMGYCGPKPFDMKPQGFQCTLGGMRTASSACWHIFKKGFCRHQESCSKQHPACEMPVHVLVEGVQLDCCPRNATAFKQVVADMALTVTSALEASPYVSFAATFKDKDHPGWTIELTAKDEFPASTRSDYQKEHLLMLAKKALFSASSNLDIIHIMGHGAKPFMPTAHGFVTIIGDMQDETRVCWDLYSKGCCSRTCECRWEHPECLMPINVVVKEKASCSTLPISLHAAIQQISGGCGQVSRR